MSFSFLPTTDSTNEEDESPGIAISSPKLAPLPSPTSREETPVENHHNDVVTSQRIVRSDRRIGRERRRRAALRRQSSSPGPPPLLISASHFTNDLSPPQSEASTPSVTPTTMAAVNMDEMTRRMLREEEESLALARMLMAEEAMESYARSADFLQQNAQFYSPEDLEALQAVLQEDDEGSTTEDDLSYDTMVRLGERIGDVKSERWAIIARDEINKLEEFTYRRTSSANNSSESDDSTVKCLVCQFAYEPKEKLRKLPCGHCFHSNCVGSWLLEKDSCPYCRQPLIPNHDY